MSRKGELLTEKPGDKVNLDNPEVEIKEESLRKGSGRLVRISPEPAWDENTEEEGRLKEFEDKRPSYHKKDRQGKYITPNMVKDIDWESKEAVEEAFDKLFEEKEDDDLPVTPAEYARSKSIYGDLPKPVRIKIYRLLDKLVKKSAKEWSKLSFKQQREIKETNKEIKRQISRVIENHYVKGVIRPGVKKTKVA